MFYQVVVKFIKKNKVLSECWTEDQQGKRLPLEVSLLKMLQHPNIVRVNRTLIVSSLYPRVEDQYFNLNLTLFIDCFVVFMVKVNSCLNRTCYSWGSILQTRFMFVCKFDTQGICMADSWNEVNFTFNNRGYVADHLDLICITCSWCSGFTQYNAIAAKMLYRYQNKVLINHCYDHSWGRAVNNNSSL